MELVIVSAAIHAGKRGVPITAPVVSRISGVPVAALPRIEPLPDGRVRACD